MIEQFLAALLLTRGVMAPALPPKTATDAGTRLEPTAALAHEPVLISGDHFEIQGKENTATYSGHVKVVIPNKNATLTCDKLVAHYTSGQDVKRIECEGGAEATQGDKWARGDRADFDNDKGLVVITGNPEARQGASRVSGEKFTIDLTNDTLHGDDVKTLAASGNEQQRLLGSEKRPQLVEIKGDRFDVRGKNNTATWTGHVRVHRGPTLLSCEKLTAHYGEDEQVKRADCVGNAFAQDGDKWAKGERADYDVAQGFITVTGNPEAQQGPNHMTGTRFVVDLPKDTIRGDNVRITYVPGSKPQLDFKKRDGGE